jgi:predicted DCC family thiol-disulfide oxidoreductase YuxK
VHNDPVLLYDGVCGFCNHTVQFIIARDQRGTMRFAPLQSEYGERVKQRHPMLENVDSVVYLEPADEAADERVFIRSDAALRVAEYLGGPWRAAFVARILPRPVRDFFYDLFAKHRYRFFGKHESCLMPPKEVRGRFL